MDKKWTNARPPIHNGNGKHVMMRGWVKLPVRVCHAEYKDLARAYAVDRNHTYTQPAQQAWDIARGETLTLLSCKIQSCDRDRRCRREPKNRCNNKRTRRPRVTVNEALKRRGQHRADGNLGRPLATGRPPSAIASRKAVLQPEQQTRVWQPRGVTFRRLYRRGLLPQRPPGVNDRLLRSRQARTKPNCESALWKPIKVMETPMKAAPIQMAKPIKVMATKRRRPAASLSLRGVLQPQQPRSQAYQSVPLP